MQGAGGTGASQLRLKLRPNPAAQISPITVVSPPRLYPGLAKPVMLSQLDFPRAVSRIETLYPFFRAREDERAAIFGPGPLTWLPAAAANRAQPIRT